MFTERIYNFSAGPSMLPQAVLSRAAAELLNFEGSGQSVMEMSHRSKVYDNIFQSVKAKLKNVMGIPDNYHILFMHGGATGQFSAAAMNLISKTGSADYAVTGSFSKIAAQEAKKYGGVNIVCDTADKNHTYIPPQSELRLSKDASYFHYCANNTIYGTAWKYIPETNGAPLVCDMSSCILSEPVEVSKYGVIYAGAQKNMAPAGFTVVIVRDDLEINPSPLTPKIMDYNVMIKEDSMPNTPSAYNIYVLGLVLDWIMSVGGLTAMAKLNAGKAALLYDYLDNSKLFTAHALPEARSIMNVTFRTESGESDAAFIKGCDSRGLVNLKGHRSVGGMRASIYNAMPVEGVKALVSYMREFEAQNA